MEINEEKRNQWQALKGMGFKAHWDYFWDYYKIHVIVAVFIIVFVVMLIKDIASNKPYALNAMFINANTMEYGDTIEAAFAEKEGINTEDNEVFIDLNTTLSVNGTTSQDMTTTEKIYAMIGAKELDAMLADPQVFEQLASNEVFLDLRDYFSDEELASLGDKVYYIDYAEIEEARNAAPDFSEEAMRKAAEEAANYSFERRDPSEMTTPVPVGIILTDSKVLSDNSLYLGSTPISGIVGGTERGETGADLIRYLLGSN